MVLTYLTCNKRYNCI